MHVPVERVLVYPARLTHERDDAPPAAPLARAPFDRTLLLVVPAALFMLLLFVYPFLYGLLAVVRRRRRAELARQLPQVLHRPTICGRRSGRRCKLALPATLINVGFALPIAFKMRVKTRYQRWVTTILVVPITLGTVLIAEGMLTYFGPKGWLVAVPAVLPPLRRPDPPDAQLLRAC